MKTSILSLIAVMLFGILFSQNTANRFFYEFSYKKYNDFENTFKTLTILDITGKKSIYRDYLTVSQDSIIQDALEKAKKSGVQVDVSKIMKFPNFTYKVIKDYPIKDVRYLDKILQDEMGYIEPITYNWSILDEKQKIGEFMAQKAVVDYGGRKWIAWFTESLPFQDGPYKFFGLPGLILKIEDEEKLFSWLLSGIRKIENYSEFSLADRGTMSNTDNKTNLIVTKDKFLKIYNEYLENPLSSIKGKMTPEQLAQKMPDGKTVAESFKSEESKIKKILNNNRIDIETTTVKK
ncbi:MAG: GLPGLI family protein [Cruoricaptor ignavus]|nr:GLPGLI family protein [Cruoricaptor ignavus]